MLATSLLVFGGLYRGYSEVHPVDDAQTYLESLRELSNDEDYDSILGLFRDDAVFDLMEYEEFVGKAEIDPLIRGGLFGNGIRQHYSILKEAEICRVSTIEAIYTYISGGVPVSTNVIIQFDINGYIDTWAEMVTSDINAFDSLGFVPKSLLPEVFSNCDEALEFDDTLENNLESAIRVGDMDAAKALFGDPSSSRVLVSAAHLVGRDEMGLESLLLTLFACGSECNHDSNALSTGRRSLLVELEARSTPEYVVLQGQCLMKVNENLKVSSLHCHV